jgi:hypothetical protein
MRNQISKIKMQNDKLIKNPNTTKSKIQNKSQIQNSKREREKIMKFRFYIFGFWNLDFEILPQGRGRLK